MVYYYWMQQSRRLWTKACTCWSLKLLFGYSYYTQREVIILRSLSTTIYCDGDGRGVFILAESIE